MPTRRHREEPKPTSVLTTIGTRRRNDARLFGNILRRYTYVVTARPTSLTLEKCLEWRQQDWLPATEAALAAASPYLLPTYRVLEIGYRSGLMACYLASYFGVRVIGYDTEEKVASAARRNAESFGLGDQVDFRWCSPSDTLTLSGSYDAVFVKSVLTSVGDNYEGWLQWIVSVLRPGGILIAVENGPGIVPIKLVRILRKAAGAYYPPSPLDPSRLESFANSFDLLNVHCSGRWAPLFGGFPSLHRIVTDLDGLCPVGPKRSFVTSVVARRPPPK